MTPVDCESWRAGQRRDLSDHLYGWRSRLGATDAGNAWTQINDSNHNWYYSGYVITGDPNRVGRVYIATNGRGIIYGDATP